MDLQAPGPTPNPGNISDYDTVLQELEDVITRLRRQFNPSRALSLAITNLEQGKLWLQEAAKTTKEEA